MGIYSDTIGPRVVLGRSLGVIPSLDAIDEALDKFREDMRATKLVRQPDGSITEVPAWFMKPRDVALLIDRLQVLHHEHVDTLD